jgi:hypothetical protein
VKDVLPPHVVVAGREIHGDSLLDELPLEHLNTCYLL